MRSLAARVLHSRWMRRRWAALVLGLSSACTAPRTTGLSATSTEEPALSPRNAPAALVAPAGVSAVVPAVAVSVPTSAPAISHAYQQELPPRPRAAPAHRTAKYSPAQCQAELRKRGIAVQRGTAPGVATPVRLASPLQGVTFTAPGKRSVYGVLDCRLALALDDFARILARHEVVRVRVDNMYRPRARLPGRKNKSQHAYGLAADVMSFELSDGRVLLVEQDWQGAVGTPPCGPEARLQAEVETAILLRNMICEVAREGLFNHLLTPSYDAAHRDHLHLDIKRDARDISIN